jgi:hypothetical protein
MRQYTPKQIEKYKRQKYISALNKCTKNLYKLLKNEDTTYEIFRKKFIQLKDELDKIDEVRLDTEHIKKVKEYIEKLFLKTILSKEFSNNDFLDIKNSELNMLNRLQKMKNRSKYSKTKHKEIFY